MLVDKLDGSCTECNGQLNIVEVTTYTMTCVCVKCEEEYEVEIDAFNDGGIHYWPNMMAKQEEGSYESYE